MGLRLGTTGDTELGGTLPFRLISTAYPVEWVKYCLLRVTAQSA